MPWDPPILNSQVLAIHAALLPLGPRGKILYFGGDEHNAAQNESGNPSDIDNTRLFDIDTQAISTLGSPTTDIFCSGHAQLPDGRLLVGGGTAQWGTGNDPNHNHGGNFGGHRACWAYQPRAATWQQLADMNPEPGRTTGGGRWYPTLVTLGDGKILAFSGHPHRSDTRHENSRPEVFSPTANTWTNLPNDLFTEYYPRVHLLPNGKLFFTTPVSGQSRIIDAATGLPDGSGFAFPGGAPYSYWNYPAVLLPLMPSTASGQAYRPRVLLCGGNPKYIDLAAASPSWQDTDPRAMTQVRQYACTVLLPTGQVFVSGGVSQTNPEQGVLQGEIYTPAIDWATGTYTGHGTWQTVEAAQVTRNYHSVALLMPDGRVWTAGSSKNEQQGDPAAVGEMRIEIYRPPYDAMPNRPQITQAPASIPYGQQFELRSPQAAAIRRVVLMRMGSVTHAFDADQRYIVLELEPYAAGDGDVRRVRGPPNGNVAPPGNYMLWIIDDQGRPCQTAKFVRASHQSLSFTLDRSTFSTHEVEALLTAGPARFSKALYLVADGFLPSEVGAAPTVTLHLDSAAGTAPPGLTAIYRETLYETPTPGQDIAQRITYVYDLQFTDATVFNSFTETRDLWAMGTLGAHRAVADLLLTKQPNPYMRDGDVSWLSTDLRVFQIREGQSRAGVNHNGGDNSPHPFISSLLAQFNNLPSDEFHPFLSLAQDGPNASLELSRSVNGQRVYNYAIAKVRYRANSVSAPGVKVFFRLMAYMASRIDYDPSTTYKHIGSGAATKPDLGVDGGELVSIPCFAEPRIDDLSMQTDPLNEKTLMPSGAQEFIAYYGCWLDFNQETERFPRYPDSPVNAGNPLRSIQQLVDGHHQCLVAEVFFVPDPIGTGDTPGSSENLAQRNLAIVKSDNPGPAETHLVQHPFDVKPSPYATFQAVGEARALTHGWRGGGPDELVIEWNDVPRDAVAHLYFPQVDADDILALAGMRQGPPVLSKVDEHTVACQVGDITYVPLPPRTSRMAGLFSIQLPPTVTVGQSFHVDVRQSSGGWVRRMVGAFRITIPVSTGPAMLPEEIRKLSVLRHVQQAIPATDRWHPVFERYLDQIAGRVRGLGGDPDTVEASPDGTGKAEPPKGQETCRQAKWWLPAILASLAALVAVAPPVALAPVLALGFVLVLAVACAWLWKYRPGRCDWVLAFLLGFMMAGSALGLLVLLGMGTARVIITLAVLSVLTSTLLIAGSLTGCLGVCCPPKRLDPGRLSARPSPAHRLPVPQAAPRPVPRAATRPSAKQAPSARPPYEAPKQTQKDRPKAAEQPDHRH